jgi:putative DNA primase/helicase
MTKKNDSNFTDYEKVPVSGIITGYFITPERDGKQFLNLTVDNGKTLETVSFNLLTNKWDKITEGKYKGAYEAPTYTDYTKFKLATGNCGAALVEYLNDNSLASGKIEIMDIAAEPEILGYHVDIEVKESCKDGVHYQNYAINQLRKPENYKSIEINTDPEEFKRFNDLLKTAVKFPFYFPLCIGNKDPLEGMGSWKKNRLTFEQAYLMMQRGHNIGIAATDLDYLCIVDVDDMTQVPEIKPTLQIASRKRVGRHNFFVASDTASDMTAKKNIATNNAGEVRSVWQYVVVSGSYVACSDEEILKIPEEDRANAGKYTICNDSPIEEISYRELPIVYKRRDSEKQFQVRNAKLRPDSNFDLDNGYRSKLWRLDMSELTGIEENGNRRYPMPNGFHDTESGTGKNADVSRGLLHCFRHECYHNAFSYLAVTIGLTTCEKAGSVHSENSGYGVDKQDGEIVFKVWSYAKFKGYLPADDPIPYSALTYYALSKNLCEESDIGKDGKIPRLSHNIAMIMSKKEGISFNRGVCK